MEWILFTLAAICVLAAAIPISQHTGWWIRWFEFPRVQLSILTIVVGISFPTLTATSHTVDFVVMVLLAAAALLQIWHIAPYTRLYPTQLKDADGSEPAGTSLRLLVANVYTPNRNAPALVTLVKDHAPDVLLTVETDDWWEAQLSELEADFPHRVARPLANTYGMHLYSRLPLHDIAVRYLIEDDVPSIRADVLLGCGQRVRLYCLHPAPPSPTENDSSLERDGELLLVAKELERGSSVVALGDLNDVAWSATTRLFQRISGLLDPRIGRGIFTTFHARYPLLRWPLDHVFCSSDFALASMRRLPQFGSDHFPILVELVWHGARQLDVEPPTAAPAEEQLADDKIEEALDR